MAEITDELITSAKRWLRISTTSADEEVGQVMAACLIDLKTGGVSVLDPTDAAIQQAMKLYLKAHFGYDSNAERFAAAYEHLKAALALSGDYGKEAT